MNNTDYRNTKFKLNNEAHDDNNSHLNNIHSCLSECDYYTDSELNAIHVNVKSNCCISTLSINCRSISKNFENIECSLKSLDNKFDFVGLTETWLKTNDNSDIYNLPDYTLLSRPRTDKRGGGVGLYVTDKTSFKVRDDLVMNHVTCQYESLFIETVMHDHKVVIGVIYKPPESTTDTFVAHFSDVLGIISKERKQCILMGDFNLDLIKVDNNNQTKDFVHSLYTNAFYPTISKPTRVTEHSATLLDNIITNITGYCIKSGVLYNDISDHFPVFNLLQINSKISKKYEYIFKRMNTVNNIEKLNTELKNANWDDVFVDENPDSAYDTFLSILTSFINKCLPLKKVKRKINDKSEWLTKGILISCVQKNNLFKKLKKTPSQENELTYKTFKNKLTHLIRIAKKNYFKEKFDMHRNNGKKTWETIGEILKNKNRKTTVTDTFITPNGKTCTDKTETANNFNKYFTTVGNTLAANLPQTGNDPIELIESNPDNFFCVPATPAEINNIILHSKSKKSTGFDNIDSYIVKQIAPQIVNQLADIFNKSFLTGIVPSKLKIAKVIPLYKAKDPALFSNYRPISLLPVFSKILERLMYNRLYNFLTEHNILSTNQFGFRKKYSTFLALMDLVDNISKNIDEGNYSIGIFLDLSKAFDTIDHTILLDKLCRYGVRGVTLNWFKHYLNDRKQFVSYNNTTSVSMKVTCGVPQGSILGPLLFILYVNDITKVSNIFKINLFADDTSLIHTHDNFEYLIKETNEELIRISTWLATNKLVLNINKTNYMIFTSRGKSYNKNVTNITIDGNNIQQVNKTKFLGIIIEEHLNWATHISHLCNIIARNVGILQKLRYFVPAYVLKILYHSLILSHLQYCTLLWANSYYSHLQKLRLLQKKAIRIISNADYLAHSSKLFLNLKLLKLDDIMKFQLGTFMYKLKYNKLPSAIPHMFVTNENIHSHNTRNKNGYLIPNVRTNCRKFTVSYAGPILWNSFPQKLRQLPSEVLFKRKLKYILLATY